MILGFFRAIYCWIFHSWWAWRRNWRLNPTAFEWRCPNCYWAVRLITKDRKRR